MFATFKKKDILCLMGVIIIGFGWLLIDQFFFPLVIQRFIALFVLLLVLFFFQFKVNNPVHIFKYANTLMVISLGFIVVVSTVTHIIMLHDFDYRSVLIWILTAMLPYLSALLYNLFRKRVK
jgi:hypothetical protein